jgi:hypothetical protein
MARQAVGVLLKKDDSMKQPRPRHQVNWPGVAGLALMAISTGMTMAWVYTVIRLAQIF